MSDAARLAGWRRARSWLGVIALDLPRYVPLMTGPAAGYLALCNRDEQLEAGPDGVGYACRWKWTSDLHAPKVWPRLGRRILRQALADHPVRRANEPQGSASDPPEITFLVGHRGNARLPHLLATLESIAAQHGARVECIVIEQETESRLRGALPAWVRHVHLPPPDQEMPYCRSWAFNVGALHARGGILVLHDNDMLVPADYAASLRSRVEAGFDVVNLKRFVFYLSELQTATIFSGHAGLCDMTPLAITQNLEGGGSVAITQSAYERIGGMDESFVGWGGEDNDFWERAQTLRVWPFAHLPIVHLWHAAQPGKHDVASGTAAHYGALSRVPPRERIDRLARSARGLPSGPSGWRVGAESPS